MRLLFIINKVMKEEVEFLNDPRTMFKLKVNEKTLLKLKGHLTNMVKPRWLTGCLQSMQNVCPHTVFMLLCMKYEKKSRHGFFPWFIGQWFICYNDRGAKLQYKVNLTVIGGHNRSKWHSLVTSNYTNDEDSAFMLMISVSFTVCKPGCWAGQRVPLSCLGYFWAYLGYSWAYLCYSWAYLGYSLAFWAKIE